MDRKQLRSEIVKTLADIGDPVLAGKGFKRKKRTLRYQRKLLSGNHWVIIDFRLPRYSDDPSLCHLKLVIGASFPEVNAMAVHLVDGDPQLGGFFPDVTYAFTVGECGPERAFKDWRPENIDDLHNKMQDMINYLLQFGTPFLDKYQTSSSLVQGYLNGEYLFMRNRPLAVTVIAAALCTSQNNIAKEIADRELGTLLGIRRRYAILFERLNALTGGATVE
ncbi:hypothetical protein LJC22_07020 [Desulfosarcina sp. OttesenSCG-928-G10]|nr:hypothetical protein [Desulfosarcina sp. OttesenSCG-928-G10]